MALLCDAVAVPGLLEDRICTIYPTGNAFGQFTGKKNHIFGFWPNFGVNTERPYYLDFFNKWSWGVCVMLLQCQAYRKMESVQSTPRDCIWLIYREKNRFWTYMINFGIKVARPGYFDFLNE